MKETASWPSTTEIKRRELFPFIRGSQILLTGHKQAAFIRVASRYNQSGRKATESETVSGLS